MSSIQCRELADGLLERWFDGGVDREVAAAVEAHLSGCADCRAQHEALAEEASLLGAVLLADRTAYEKAGEPAALPAPRKSRVPATRWLAMAASLLLVLGGANYFSGVKVPQPTDDSLIVSLDLSEARAGETVMLPIRVHNARGTSGLKLTLKFDPAQVEVFSASDGLGLSNPTLASDTLIIATVGQDGWLDRGGIAFNQPIRIREDVPPNTLVRLDCVEARVSANGERSVPVHPLGGDIRIAG